MLLQFILGDVPIQRGGAAVPAEVIEVVANEILVRFG
jgi:hypothetical protein